MTKTCFGESASSWVGTAASRKMVLTSWFLPSMLLLLLPIMAGGVKLKEVEGKCEGGLKCLHHMQCEPFKKAVEQMRLLKKPSCELREARQEMREAVCNR